MEHERPSKPLALRDESCIEYECSERVVRYLELIQEERVQAHSSLRTLAVSVDDGIVSAYND